VIAASGHKGAAQWYRGGKVHAGGKLAEILGAESRRFKCGLCRDNGIIVGFGNAGS